MKTYKWYRFTFSDGYVTIRRGLNSMEKAAMERQHGKLVSKVFEGNA